MPRESNSHPRARVVVYERVSTDHQDIVRQSVQRDLAQADYPGCEPLVIQDDGVSAFKVPIFDRPGGRRLCELVEAGGVEVIYADAQDRLSRGDDLEWVTFRTLCETNGTRMVIDGRELRNDLGGKVEGYLKALLARQESLDKSHRVKGGKRLAAEQGRPHGGWSPYGYRYGRWHQGEPQGLLIVPEEAEIVRRVFREWRQGKPQKQIARDLNIDGVRPQRTSMWGQSSVGRMLRNPTYAARRELKGEVIDSDQWEAIIARDEFEEAQRLLAPRGSKKRSGRPAPGFLLRGLLICGECGAPMHTDRGGKRSSARYVCYTNEKNPHACSVRGFRRSDVDEGVLSYFEDACIDAEASWQACREAADARVAETRALRQQAEREALRLAAQLDRADDDYGAGTLAAADYRRLREKWGGQREAATAEVERLRTREVEIDRAASPEFTERLAVVREAVAGRIHDARDDAGVEAVRAALASLFAGFVVSRAATAPGATYSYRLVPRLREDVAGGDALIPGRKVALTFPPDSNPAQEAEGKYHVAEALSYRAPAELVE